MNAPLSPETLVNVFTTGDQSQPRIAALADGSYVVVWTSAGQDGDQGGVYAQRYTAQGERIGLPFRANETALNSQGDPAVAGTADGGFVVVWSSRNQDNPGDFDFGVVGRRYGADGQPAGGEFIVNDVVARTQSDASVAGLPGGGFVVSFTDNFADGNFDQGVRARLYDAAGAPAGTSFIVATATAGTQSDSEVAAIAPGAALPGGGFVVVYESPDSNSTGIFAQRYAVDGTPLGAEFQVNGTVTTGQQRLPDVTGLAGGRFVVVFDEDRADGSGFGVMARIYEGDGTPVGPEFQVNEIATGNQTDPKVTATADGGFVVSFTSDTFNTQLDPSGDGVFARRFDADGAALTGDTLINRQTSGAQNESDVAPLPGGDFVVAFTSDTSGPAGDGSGDGVFQRLFGDAASFVQPSASPAVEAVSATRSFTEAALNAAPRRIDADGAAAVSDRDSADFDGGRLIVSIIAQTVTEDDFPPQDADGQDVLGFETGGRVTLSGADIAVDGTVVGAVSGGTGGGALEVALNANATPAAVEVLVEHLTYRNVSDDPRPSTQIAILLEDGDGAASEPVTVTIAVAPETDVDGPVRGELTVNTVRADTQQNPSVATLYDPATGAPDGYVVVWESRNQDRPGDGDFGVYAQRYDRDGLPVGGEFRVNQTVAFTQFDPVVAGLADGGFVVAWIDDTLDGSSDGIVYSRYDAAGAPVAAETEVVVNTETSANQFHPRLAALSDGGFVVGWTSPTSGTAGDGSGNGVFVQRFNAAGGRVGGEQLVNETTTGNQTGDGLAALNDGRFAAVWVSPGADGQFDVYARLFDALGAPEGGEFRVNTQVVGRQDFAQVAALTGGDFVVVWRSEGQDGSSGGIYQQRYTAAGAAVGGEVRVNDLTSGDQTTPTIAALSDGGWVVGFVDTSSPAPGSGADVWTQRFSADGSRVDSQQLINSDVSGTQNFSSSGGVGPTLAALQNGAYVAVWENNSVASGDIRQQIIGDPADFTASFPPVIEGLPGVRAVSEDAANAGVLLAPVGSVRVTDADSPDFDGGRLVVSRLVASLDAEDYNAPDDNTQDALTLAPIATPEGAVALAGGQVSVGGVVVGAVVSDGAAGADLEIAFNAAATAARVEAVVRALSYVNASDNPQASRTYAISLSDGDGALQEPTSVEVRITQSPDAGGPVAVGGEALVNSFIPGAQNDPEAAALDGGGWVVVWTSAGQDGDGTGVRAQRYAADGAKAGPEIAVNSVTAGAQQDAAVAGLVGGGFVVVWEGVFLDAPGVNDFGVIAQRYDASGAPVGAEFVVNTTTAQSQFDPAVTGLADGGFAVAWTTDVGDGSSDGIAYQRFSAAGAPVGGEIIVNEQVSGNQGEADLAQLSDGRVVVVWTSPTSGTAGDGSSNGVFARLINADGTFAGGEFPINQETLNAQDSAKVVATPGGFAVVWDDNSGQDGSGAGVVGRFFDLAGAPLGDEFVINENRSSTQDLPAVAALGDGRLAVAFETQQAPGGSSTDVSVQVFAADGSRLDGEARVNVQTSGQQFQPTIAALPNGNFVVAFASNTSGAAGDGSGDGVFQRVFGDPADFAGLGVDEIIGLPLAVTLDEADVNAGFTPIDPDRTVAVPPLQGGFAAGGAFRAAVDFTPAQLGQFAAPDDASQHNLGLIPGQIGAGDVQVAAMTVGAQVSVNGVVIGVIASDGANGAALEIALNAAATQETVEALIGALGYANASDDPEGLRVAIDVSNGAGFSTRTAFVDIAAAPDQDGPTADAPDRVVNTHTQSDQFAPEIVELAGGGWVVVWQSVNQDNLNVEGSTGVFAQLYAADGAPVGPEIAVNATVANQQQDPAVAALSGGGFVVVWEGTNQDQPGVFDFGVIAQRFDAAGARVGGEIVVNTTVAQSQFDPSVAALANDGFVVAFTSDTGDGSGRGVLTQRVDATGALLGEAVVSQTNNISTQNASDVATLHDAGGAVIGHVVVFQSNTSGATGDGSQTGVFAQVYDLAGARAGGEVQVNTTTLGDQFQPKVTGLEGGGWVVVWTDDRADGSSNGVFAQRYDAANQPVGGEFRVNDTTSSSQSRPDVAALAGGGFVVTWDGNGAGDSSGVFAQVYDAAGARVDGEQRVNTETSSTQGVPSVTGVAGGGYVVAFQAITSGTSGDGSGNAVALRAFTPTPGLDASPVVASEATPIPVFADDAAAGAVRVVGFDLLDIPQPASLVAPSLEVYFTAGETATDQLSIIPRGPLAVSGADILLGGVVVATVDAAANGANGAPLRLAFTPAGASETAIRAVIEAIGYGSTAAAGAIANTDRGLGLSLRDGAGGQSEPAGVFLDIRAGSAPAALTLARFGEQRGDTNFALTPQDEAALVAGAQRLDASVDFSDGIGASFAGGFVRLDRSSFNDTTLQFGILNVGTGAGEIGVSGADVTFGGVVIGTIDATQNGDGDDLQINLTAAADEAAIDALVDSFTVDLSRGASDFNPGLRIVVQNGAGQSVATQTLTLPIAGTSVQPAPAPETRVNTFTANDQDAPRLAVLDDGGYVVVWTSRGQDNPLDNARGIFGQRYDADGDPVGVEFQVNDLGQNDQILPSVAGLAGGGFVISWTETSGRDGSGQGVFAQRYDAGGAPAGAAFQLNEQTFSTQSGAQLVALDNGRFMALWTSESGLGAGDGSGQGIVARVFDANGAPEGGDFVVNATTLNQQTGPQATVLPDGDVVVVWTDTQGNDGSGSGVYARRIDATGALVAIDGSALGGMAPGEILVNTTTAGEQGTPFVAALAPSATLPQGGFVVTWQSNQDPGDSNNIYAQVFDHAGARVGGETLAIQRTTASQFNSLPVATPDGGFTLIYGDNSGVDGSGQAVLGQRLNPDLSFNGAPFIVNSETSSTQSTQWAAQLPNGALVVVWRSETSGTAGDGSSGGIFQTVIGAPAGSADPVLVNFTNGAAFAESAVNAGLQLIDPDGVIGLTDADSPNFDGGSLLVARVVGAAGAFTAQPGADDSAAQDGLGFLAGNGVDLQGANVRVDGATIGVLTQDGQNGAALEVTFNAAATPELVERLLARLAYENGSGSPAPSRDFSVVIRDGDGGATRASTFTVTVTPEPDLTVAPVGADQQVNSYTPGEQVRSDVATLFDPVSGDPVGHVVVWVSQDQDRVQQFSNGVYGQVYDLQGQPVGAEFRVNAHTDGTQTLPSVAGLVGGGFVVAWRDDSATSPTGDASGQAVVGRVFDNTGQALTGDFAINEQTSSNQGEPSVTALADGGFAAAWASETSGSAGDGSGRGVFGRTFDATGAPRGGEFQLNGFTTSTQDTPALAQLSDGNLVAVWESTNQDNPGDGDRGLYARIVTPAGVEVVAEFQVNSTVISAQFDPSIAALAGGGFVVSWTDNGGADGSGTGVFLQRFDNAGARLGGETRVNDATSSTQHESDVTALANGGFVVTFTSFDSAVGGGGSGEIVAQVYDATGARVDSNFVVNDVNNATQSQPSVAAAGGEAFVVSFTSQTSGAIGDGSGSGIFVKRVAASAASEAPALTGASATVAFDEAAVNAAPQLLFPNVSFGDADSANLAGGRLVLAMVENDTVQEQFPAPDGPTQDQLGVATGGAVSVSGATVSVDGAAVGTLVGFGSDGAALEIAFGPGATAARVERLIEALTYANISDDPETARLVSLSISDGAGGVLRQTKAIAITPQADAFRPVGDERLTNSQTDNQQTQPDVATLFDPATGEPSGYVIVWESTNQDATGDNDRGVFGQVYDVSGAPVGGEFRVNATTISAQFDAQAVGLATGGFVVAWIDNSGTRESGQQVIAQVYDAGFAPVGGEVFVNAAGFGQSNPALAAHANGDWTVVRQVQNDQSPFEQIIFGQRFSDTGGSVGAEFRIEEVGNEGLGNPDVAVLADGKTVVVYEATNLDNPGDFRLGVFAQLFGADGAALGAPVRVNDRLPSDQFAPRVAATAEGFVVAFVSNGGDNGQAVFSGEGVFAQRYDLNGAAIGANFLVNEEVDSTESQPDVIGLPGGGFTVAFTDFGGTDGSSGGVFTQTYAADGRRLDGQIQINQETSGSQDLPAIAALGDGAYVVAWASDTSATAGDGSGDGVYHRIVGDPAQFAVGGAPVVDGVNAEVVYVENTVNGIPQLIDANGAAAVSDPDSANFEGGSLLVSNVQLSAPLIEQINAPDDLTQDILGLRQGPRIAIDAGGAVSVDGAVVGTVVRNGQAGAPFEIALTAAATPEVVELLVENLTYRNVSDDPEPVRTLRITLTDGDGGASDPVLVRVRIEASTDAASALGGEQRANATTAGAQDEPAVATLADGTFVVVWEGDDASGRGVFAQRVDALGNPLARDGTALASDQRDEFRVNGSETGAQNLPTVTALDDGGFVIGWEGPDASGTGVIAQRFDAAGAAVGATDFRVNTQTSSTQSNVEFTALQGPNAGQFVAVYQAFTSGGSGDGSSWGITAQRFDATGAPVGPEFVVNGVTAGGQTDPAVTALSDGGFFVTWTADGGQDGSLNGVFGRRVDASGTPQGADIQLNVTTLGSQDSARVVALAGGELVVVWRDDRADGSSSGVFAQVYDANGAPLTQQFRVNDQRISTQDQPDVAALSTGGFVVVWDDAAGTDGSGQGIFAQQYEADGSRLDSQFQVNVEFSGAQFQPVVTALENGGFAVAWTSQTSGTAGDGSSNGVYYRVYGNEQPAVSPVSASGDEDVTFALGADVFEGGFVDPGGQTLQAIRIETLPAQGVLALNGAPVTPGQVVGNLDLLAGALTYTGDANFFGQDEFLWTGSDGTSFAPQLVEARITVEPVNDAPALEAGPDATLGEGVNLNRQLIVGDPDVETRSFTVDFGDGTAPVSFTSGSATPSINHVFGAEGVFTVTVTVDDNAGAANSVESDTFEVTVVNAAPRANNDFRSVAEDGPAIVIAPLANDDDPGADPIALTLVNGQPFTAGQPIALASGAVITVNADGTISYDPNGAFEALADFQNGSDSFTYAIEDDAGLSDSATVFVTIDGANDAPEAADDVLTANDDTAIVANVLADNGAGPDSDVDAANTLTVTALNGEAADIGQQVTLPSGATVTLQADGTLDYDPTTLPAGTAADSFEYTVSDGRGGSDTATVSITINPTNLAPVAQDDAIALTEDAGTTGNVLADNGAGPDSDADGDPLTVTAVAGQGANVGQPVALAGGAVVTLQANGSFTVSPGGGYQTLAEGQSATETFTYTVEDGNGGSDVATVTLTIAGVNDAPSVPNLTIDADEGGPAATGDVLAGASDVDAGDTRSVTAVNGVAADVGQPVAVAGGGLVTVAANGAASFDPNGAYESLDAGDVTTRSVTFTVTDAAGAAVTRTLFLRVTGENDAPVAADDSFGVSEGQNLTGNLFADNGDGPDADVDAGAILSVSAVNGDAANLARGVTLASGANVTVNPNGTFTYLQNGAFDGLNAGETGSDSFTYTLRDQNGATDTATVTVTVTGAADAPVAVDDAFAIDENGSVTANVLADNGVGADFDPNGDPISVTAVDGDPANLGVTRTLASGATVSISATGALVYATGTAFDALAEGASATETIGYTISDGLGGTDDGQVIITLTGVNDAPVARRDEFEVDEDAAFADNLLLNNGFGADFDVDAGDAISVSAVNGETAAVGQAVTLASGATVTVAANGDVTYAQNGAFDSLSAVQTAQESFTYTIADGLGATATATVEFTIRGLNDAPEAVDDSFSVTASGSVSGNVIAGVNAGPDTDVDDGDVLSVTAVNGAPAALGTPITLPSGATLTLNADGTFTYDAATAGFTAPATDSFDYTLSDGRGGVDVGLVSITISADANTPPVANPIALVFGEDQTGRVVNLLDPAQVSDAEGDDLDVTTLTLTAADGRTVGFALDAETGALTLDDGGFEDLGDGETLVLTAAYGVTDGSATTPNTATITVEGANDAPVAVDDAFETDEDARVSGNLLAANPAVADSDADGDPLTVVSVTSSGGVVRPVDAATGSGLFILASGAHLRVSADGSFTYDPFGFGFGGTASLTDFDRLDDGETGVETVTYIVADGNGGFDEASATITVTGVNDAPVAVIDSVTLSEDDAEGGVNLLNGNIGPDVDPEGGPLTITQIALGGQSVAVDPLLGGTLTLGSGAAITVLADGTATFFTNGAFEDLGDRPGQLAQRTINFTYTVADQGGLTDTALLQVFVTGVNDAPEAVDDGPFAATEGGVTGLLDVLANDGDAEGDALSIVGGDAFTALGGTVVVAADGRSLSVDYSAVDLADLAEGETRADSFQYVVSDGDLVDGATVTLTLTGKADETGPNLVLGTDGIDRLTGTEGADLIRSLGGRADFVEGLGGADVFDFSDSTANGVRETRTVLDYVVGEDAVALGAASVVQLSERAGVVRLLLDGDGDVITLRGVSDFDDIAFV